MLNPRQFFHGSVADLKPGDVIHPAGRDRLHPQTQRWRGEHVWATPSEHGAWWYAKLAEQKSGNPKVYGNEVGNARRPRVFEVEPIGATQKRRRLSQSEPEEHSMPAARVRRVIDIPPPEHEEPVQGRLPLDKSWDNWKGMLKYSGHDTSWEDHEYWSRSRHPEMWEPRKS